MSTEQTPATLEGLLEQRGVTGVEALVNGLGEKDFFNLDACVAAVARYDKEGQDAPGLLVYRVREAATSKYRPKGKEGVTAGTPSPELLASIRRSCNSPNGFSRSEARGILAEKARRLRLDPDRLIDAAMGAEWRFSMPHPALDLSRPREERARSYEEWVAGPDVVAKLAAIEL